MKRILIAWLLIAVMLISCACKGNIQPDALKEETQAQTQSASEADEDSEQAHQTLAPDFTVYDIDGQPVKLSDFRGTPVILNFWASWCGPCKMEMPDFDTAFAEHGTDIQFMMVNLTDGTQETVESASQLIQDLGYSFPVFYDTDMAAAAAYGVYSIPTTYFIDAEGYVVAYGTGAMELETVEQGIGMILPAE